MANGVAKGIGDAVSEAGPQRTKVLVAGAGGSIGAAVCRDLARGHDVVALVGTSERASTAAPQPGVSWRACELFSRAAVDEAIAGCDYVVYLVHTRVPTARLDQAACDDMDLLIADNVARAASHHGVRQIVFFGGLVPRQGLSTAAVARRREVVEALSFYGTPVTALRAGLVIAPGSSALALLEHLVGRLPVVPIPEWSLKRRQPIAVEDVARGIAFCLGNAAVQSQEFAIGGPAVISHQELLRNAAQVLGRKPKFVTVRWMPRRVFGWYLRLLSPRAHRTLVHRVVEMLADETVAADNVVQRFVAAGAAAPRAMLEAEIRRQGGRLPANPRAPIVGSYLAGLRSRRSVRSIQRIALPKDRDATWVAGHYFRWLRRFAWPFVVCDVDEPGSYSIRTPLPRPRLLELSFQPDESAADRRMYYVSGGLLARKTIAGRPRLEFRDVLGGRASIVAIHDFAPRLPWFFYRASQATIHLFVMRAFQRHMTRVAAGAEAPASEQARGPDA
jgi:nucleoside-diphosphate-sugar epimerase